MVKGKVKIILFSLTMTLVVGIGAHSAAVGLQNYEHSNSHGTFDTIPAFRYEYVPNDNWDGIESSWIFEPEFFSSETSEVAKAAVVFEVTFAGNNCEWDGVANSDFSNLACPVLSRLNLGYQCSPTHLNYVRSMFARDTETLHRLDEGGCNMIPNTATVQSSLDEVVVYERADTVIVGYVYAWINTREGLGEQDYRRDTFLVEDNTLRFVGRGVIRGESFEF